MNARIEKDDALVFYPESDAEKKQLTKWFQHYRENSFSIFLEYGEYVVKKDPEWW